MPKRGELVNGEVIRIKKNNKDQDIGALVKLTSGEVAFLPIKEVSKDYVRNMEDYVKVGDNLSLIYVEFNRKFKQHNVSLKRADTEFIFQQRLETFMKKSSETLRQVQKNKERKQVGRRKRPVTKNNNNNNK